MHGFIIQHVTRYGYEEPVTDRANLVLLFPIRGEQQELVQQQLIITGNSFAEVFRDYYNNQAVSFMNIAPHSELSIDSK